MVCGGSWRGWVDYKSPLRIRYSSQISTSFHSNVRMAISREISSNLKNAVCGKLDTDGGHMFRVLGGGLAASRGRGRLITSHLSS